MRYQKRQAYGLNSLTLSVDVNFRDTPTGIEMSIHT